MRGVDSDSGEYGKMMMLMLLTLAMLVLMTIRMLVQYILIYQMCATCGIKVKVGAHGVEVVLCDSTYCQGWVHIVGS